MIAEDNRITYREIQASLSISITPVKTILHEHLGLRKICSRWIPHHLMDVEKEARVKWCRKMIQRFNRGESKATYDIKPVTKLGYIILDRKQSVSQCNGSLQVKIIQRNDPNVEFFCTMTTYCHIRLM